MQSLVTSRWRRAHLAGACLRARWALASLAALALTFGCEDAGPVAEPDIVLTFESPTQVVGAGEVRIIPIAIDRGGRNGEVTLGIDSAPPGVTGQFDPAVTTGAASLLTLRIASSTLPGEYQVVVRARSGTASGQRELTLTVTPAIQSIGVAVSSGGQVIVPGDSARLVVTILRRNYTGGVWLELHGAPAGLGWSFTPDSTTGFVSVLALHADMSLPPGSYPLEVRGISTLDTSSASFSLTVTPPPRFSVTLEPSSLVVAAGGSAISVVRIGRTYFTGAVRLSLSGAPAGVVGTFDPDSTAGSESRLTLTAGAAVLPGEYNMEVLGTSALGTSSALLSLTVPRPPPFVISLVPTRLVAAPGSATTLAVSIARNDFTGDVGLDLRGGPPGTSWTFDPGVTAGNTSALTITLDDHVGLGEYRLQVAGTSARDTNRTSLDLSVAASNPEFAVALAPTFVQMGRGFGATESISVTLTRAPGYDKEVALTISQAPSWLRAAVEPASTAGSTSTLRLTTISRPPSQPCCYPVTVVGTSPAGRSSAVVQVGLRGGISR